MSIVDENKYRELKNILGGCRTRRDISYFSELYRKKNPEMKTLIHCFIGEKAYINCKDFVTMMQLLERCCSSEYTEDVYKIINDNFTGQDNENNIQYKTCVRIAKNKKKKELPVIDVGIVEVYQPLCSKKCPHCGQVFYGNSDTNYVVCGYNNISRGYDWTGCQNDWCFICGKMLCKSWEKNKLYVEPNRIHDSYCCQKHAQLNNRSYLDDYCQCQYKFVIRNKNCFVSDLCNKQ